MNTLSANAINDRLKYWNELNDAVKSISDGSFPVNAEGLSGSLVTFFASRIAREKYRRLLVVVPTEKDEDEAILDFKAALKEAEVVKLPGWGIVPCRPVAAGSAVFGERAAALGKAAESLSRTGIKPFILVMSQKTFLSFVPPVEYIKDQSFSLRKNQEIDTTELSARLVKNGYIRVPKVSLPGEFALRGEVLDIFLPSEENAYRVIFDFDTIEHIKLFDTENQSTISEIDEITVFPMKEVIWDEKLLNTLHNKIDEYNESCIKTDTTSEKIEDRFSVSESSCHLPFTEKAEEKLYELIDQLESGGEGEGEELLYPLAFDSSENQCSILNYFNEKSAVLFYDYDRQMNSVENILKEFSGMYRRSREDFPVLPSDIMIKDFNAGTQSAKNAIFFRSLHTEVSEDKDNLSDDKDADSLNEAPEKSNGTVLKFECEAERSFFGNIPYFKEQLESLQNEKWLVYIFAGNENQALRINEVIKDYCDSDLCRQKGIVEAKIIPESISCGFAVPAIKTIVIQENEIFGRRRHVPKSVHHAKSEAIETFLDLNPGDYVVHVNYGIGLFKGIERVDFMESERDYILLEYQDEEYVYVPIEQVNLVQRYVGNEGERPRLDKLGSKSWENRKNKVKKAVEEIAQKLIDLYSRRKTSQGFAFPKDTEWQAAFEAAFPYEDTPDQINVTREIKEDMEKPVPMDRLVCGDVGYGKTEIALRAAFKAIIGGKQVALLAPTTILAEQHYENSVERFKNFPVTIAHMSRFVTPAEQKKILARLETGEIDLLVGTHRIIQKDVKFKNLGLMIIDEEQRFGVKDKERLKMMKTNIDSLAMSATPIPRTLHMSLLKIRDMSLLTTPPSNRHPIETVIDGYSDERVVQAVRREVDRGGQVFYLHNRVESLEETRLHLQRIMPEMLIETAHGQMTSDELDDIFRRFKLGGFHILVATTIIENGIDIPNVNTIIIDRADMYGVSQLYQLRGRVGRSDRKAYAYLLYPEKKVLSEIAMKRLQVISDFTELGSGFKIAMKDMEIRGAGNLLGRDQSGDVYSVGFDMYIRLLNEAVQKLTSQKDYVAQSDVLLELEYTGFIPDTYVHSPQTKMEIYKKIASIQEKYELDGVYNELNDRFGPIPDEVLSLLTIAEIRIICKKLNISSLKEKNGAVTIQFARVSSLNIDKVLRLIKENPGRIKLVPDNPSEMILETGKIGLKEKSAFICEKLQFLA